MDASLRRSSRKRAHTTAALSVDVTEVETQSGPNVVISRKRQTVEDPETGNPTSNHGVKKRAVVVKDSVANARGKYIRFSILPKLTDQVQERLV